MLTRITAFTLVMAAMSTLSTVAAETDVLPSWNEGPAKSAIIEFVQAVIDETGSGYVPPQRRIATLDNDGTLWVSPPRYTQLAFALDRVRVLAPKHPEWKTKQPFKAVLESDREILSKLTEHDVAEIVMATHAGMTPQQFEDIVQRWLETARHPEFRVSSA